MTAYDIALKGCDGETHADMDLTDQEAALLQRVAAATTAASDYDCMPTMTITPKSFYREHQHD